jgi:hypothetical protein
MLESVEKTLEEPELPQYDDNHTQQMSKKV